jgi:hypothetical protein
MFSKSTNVRKNIKNQSLNLQLIDGKFLDVMNQIPGINLIIKKINKASLRNQVVIYIVFFTCLYFLIIAIFD